MVQQLNKPQHLWFAYFVVFMCYISIVVMSLAQSAIYGAQAPHQ